MTETIQEVVIDFCKDCRIKQNIIENLEKRNNDQTKEIKMLYDLLWKKKKEKLNLTHLGNRNE